MITHAELQEFFDTTADTYRFLSQVFFKELTEEAIDELAKEDWSGGTGNDHLDTAFTQLRRYFKFSTGDRRGQLAVDYARIFLAAGVYTKEKRCAIPYESVFTSEEHLMMGPSRNDCVARYAADGFAVNPDLHEPEDHLAFQLEYLSHLAGKGAVQVQEKDAEALDATMRRMLDFIALHQLNWVGQLLDVAQEFAKTTFYLGMLNMALGTNEQVRDMLLAAIAQQDGEEE